MPFLQAVRFTNTNSSTAAKQERANVYQYRYVARAAKNERETLVTMMMMMSARVCTFQMNTREKYSEISSIAVTNIFWRLGPSPTDILEVDSHPIQYCKGSEKNTTEFTLMTDALFCIIISHMEKVNTRICLSCRRCAPLNHFPVR
jgi:hypothetical protein